jgi:hypothetical protein
MRIELSMRSELFCPVAVGFVGVATALSVAASVHSGAPIDSISVRLVPDEPSLDQIFEYSDLEPAKAGDHYYVRVRQVDGSMAWSSPWWIQASFK